MHRIYRLAQCAVIPQALTRGGPHVRSRLPGRPRPFVVTPRGHLGPDKMGVSDPRRNGVQGRLRGGSGGRSRPQLAYQHHPRGVGGGERTPP